MIESIVAFGRGAVSPDLIRAAITDLHAQEDMEGAPEYAAFVAAVDTNMHLIVAALEAEPFTRLKRRDVGESMARELIENETFRGTTSGR